MGIMKAYFDNTDLFMECLESFIYEKKINYVPEAAIKEIVNYFIKQKKLKLV